MKPEISKEVQDRVQYCQDNFDFQFVKSTMTKGSASNGFILLKNVLIMAKDSYEDNNGEEKEGTAYVTPREKENGGYFTGGSVFFPTNKVDEFYELVTDVLSGKASGLGIAHKNFKGSKVKSVLAKDRTDQFALARTMERLYQENIEEVDEYNAEVDLEEDKKTYSPFYATLNDMSRVVIKHHLDKKEPLSDKSFKSFKDCLFMIAPTGDAPIFGRNKLRVKTAKTWKNSQPVEFDEEVLNQMPQDYTEGDIGSYALADVMINVYAGLYDGKYYIGLGGERWLVKELGFNFESAGESAVSNDADDMFYNAEKIKEEHIMQAPEGEPEKDADDFSDDIPF